MILEATLLAALAVTIAGISMKDLLHAVIVLGIGDALIGLAFYLMAAPDVAITQVAVVSGLSTMIFMIAVRKTRRLE
jgi:multicomponent Na+:H+ antiporter subunit B